MQQGIGFGHGKGMENATGKNKVLVLTGPTASGKTKAALELAEILDGEIISADSMQVYRGMDVGTAKASRAEQNRVAHHLIDIRNPGDPFSVAEYQDLATNACRDILARGKVPILCGGTGQYLSAMMEGLIYAPATVDPNLREQLTRAAETNGLDLLWRQLQETDPGTAARLSPTDQKRIIRALEIYHQTGETMSVHQARSRSRGPIFEFAGFCLNHDRGLLYARIDRRVEEMVDAGLLSEVKWLVSLDLPPTSTCLQAIGYKELMRYLTGDLAWQEAISLIQQSTRRYAKRQLTWFRKMTDLLWLENQQPEQAVQSIVQELRNF